MKELSYLADQIKANAVETNLQIHDLRKSCEEALEYLELFNLKLDMMGEEKFGKRWDDRFSNEVVDEKPIEYPPSTLEHDEGASTYHENPR